MNRIFIGYDHRQPISIHALIQSIIDNSSVPVAITPLVLPALPISRQGLTPFTYSRFIVPHLCNYEGTALFIDIDMIIRGDVAELFALADNKYAVQVTKNKKRFEWASVILYNCSHPANKVLTPEYVGSANGMHGIEWCKEEEIGSLPDEWNHLVGYDEACPGAKLVHYTQGVPAYPETEDSEHAGSWQYYANKSMFTQPWATLMGESVHVVQVNNRVLPKFLFDLEKQEPKPQYLEKVKALVGAANGNTG